MPIFPANPKENTTPPLHSRLDNKKKTRKNYDSIFENNATFLLSGIDLNLTKSGAKLSGMFRPVLRMENQLQRVEISFMAIFLSLCSYIFTRNFV